METRFLHEIQPGDRIKRETHFPGGIQREAMLVLQTGATMRPQGPLGVIMLADGSQVLVDDISVPIEMA